MPHESFASFDIPGIYLTHLLNSNLQSADLTNAALIAANLDNADLRDARLDNADFQQANVNKTCFGNNSGMTPDLKRDLIARGAIFEGNPEQDSPVLVPTH